MPADLEIFYHTFVLGKKTIDSVNCLISGTLGTSAAFSAGAWEIFFPKHSALPGLCCLSHQQDGLSSSSPGDAVPRMGTWARARRC